MMARLITWGLALLGCLSWAAPGRADEATALDAQQYRAMVSRAVTYLEMRGQADDGSFSSQTGTGVTSLVAAALLRHGRPATSPTVARALAYLDKFVQVDGGIYQPGSFHRNYETCLALMCFREANGDGRYTARIAQAEAFVRNLQWGAGDQADRSDFAYGGAGYGSHKRPDLSNTSFLIDALQSADSPANREAIQRALVFVSRCQNLESEHNTTPFSAKNPDGGFYYTPAAGGQSMAGETDTGGLRSYGSMTYAGLKSMIYAGVEPDDARVKAAVEWIRKNYTLQENPGMGQAGRYYYYHTFAKALAALKSDLLVDEAGTPHDWRAELVSVFGHLQRPDGSWINEQDRWMEGDPTLVTAYVLLALDFCRPQK